MAAAARLRHSARPACGTRTRRSADSRMHGGQPVRLVAEHERERPRQLHLEQIVLAVACPSPRRRTPAPGAPRSRRPSATSRDDRDVEDRARGRADASSGCRRRPSCRRTRRPLLLRRRPMRSTVPALPGIAYLVEHRHRTRRRRGVEGHVDEGSHPHDTLRRDGRGEPLHHPIRDRVTVDAGLPGPDGERIEIVRVTNSDSRRPSSASASATRLGSLDEEAAILLAEGSLLQPDRRDDLRVLGGRQHGAARTPARAECTRGPGRPMRLGVGRREAFAVLDELARTRPGRAPRGRRGSCGRPRPRPRAARSRSGSTTCPCGRTAALIRVIHSRRNCALRSRRSR